MTRRRRPSRHRNATVALTIVLLACDESPSDAATEEDDALLAVTLPDDEACDDVRQWPRARREQESQMFDAIEAQWLNLRSLLMIRNGYLVT